MPTSIATLGDVLARLPAGDDVAVVHDGADVIVALEPREVLRADGHQALAALEDLEAGWWAGFLTYDLGRAVESVPALATDDLPLPDLLLARFEARIRISPEGAVSAEGAIPLDLGEPTALRARPLIDWTSSLDREAFERAVTLIHHHLRRGDCYQVNLTRRLCCPTPADPLALYRALHAAHPAPHAALVRIGETAVASASPERFIRREGPAVETRPIKGTSSDADTLLRSAKDRAENVMIVDLARNDLGRVCEFGSVHAPDLCRLEEHPGLYHLVSTVRGRLRPDAGTADLIRATFPPASVTGCPKPRVLEIIESLEPVRRGVYCGAVGFIDADNDVVDLNVAIRTFTVAGGRTYLGVGGGIVADSDPGTEWEETELKARRLLAVAAGRMA